MIEDVVCTRLMSPGTEMWASRYHGRTFHFCSLACKERFELKPEDYVAAPPPRQPVLPAVPAMQ